MPREPVQNASGLARTAEKLGSLIPGYKGYKDREQLREEDRALREAVVRSLGLTLGRLERALSQVLRTLPAKDVERADKILRSLGRLRDRIRFAPGGYASLFSRKRIQRSELEAIVALDARLWDALETLDRIATDWDRTARHGEPAWPSDPLRDALAVLEDAVDERETLLRS